MKNKDISSEMIAELLEKGVNKRLAMSVVVENSQSKDRCVEVDGEEVSLKDKVDKSGSEPAGDDSDGHE